MLDSCKDTLEVATKNRWRISETDVHKARFVLSAYVAGHQMPGQPERHHDIVTVTPTDSDEKQLAAYERIKTGLLTRTPVFA